MLVVVRSELCIERDLTAGGKGASGLAVLVGVGVGVGGAASDFVCGKKLLIATSALVPKMRISSTRSNAVREEVKCSSMLAHACTSSMLSCEGG
jgi:hypothetical protein